jgi:hypothetical protein
VKGTELDLVALLGGLVLVYFLAKALAPSSGMVQGAINAGQ